MLCKTKQGVYRKYLSKGSLVARIIYELRHTTHCDSGKSLSGLTSFPTNLDPNNLGMNYQEIRALLFKKVEESEPRKIANIDNYTGSD